MKYLLFTTPTCPNCPSVKEHMKTIKIKGEFVDASTDDGLKQATTFGVSSVPTVLFFNDDDEKKVIAEAHNISDITTEIEKNKN